MNWVSAKTDLWAESEASLCQNEALVILWTLLKLLNTIMWSSHLFLPVLVAYNELLSFGSSFSSNLMFFRRVSNTLLHFGRVPNLYSFISWSDVFHYRRISRFRVCNTISTNRMIKCDCSRTSSSTNAGHTRRRNDSCWSNGNWHSGSNFRSKTCVTKRGFFSIASEKTIFYVIYFNFSSNFFRKIPTHFYSSNIYFCHNCFRHHRQLTLWRHCSFWLRHLNEIFVASCYYYNLVLHR